MKKQKMTKDGAVFAKGKIKGEVNFPPYELFDEETTREVQRFEVYPLGKIQEYSRHIPYNSEKKNFLEKTGRECFEGTVQRPKFLRILADSSFSLSIHIQSPGRRQGLHCDVGLQYWTRSHHSFL